MNARHVLLFVAVAVSAVQSEDVEIEELNNNYVIFTNQIREIFSFNIYDLIRR